MVKKGQHFVCNNHIKQKHKNTDPKKKASENFHWYQKFRTYLKKKRSEKDLATNILDHLNQTLEKLPENYIFQAIHGFKHTKMSTFFYNLMPFSGLI